MSTVYARPREGRHYSMIDGDHVAKAAVQDACGAFEIFEVIAPAAPMAPPHVSPWTAVLFLLEGRITALVDGTSYDVEPGALVVAPAGTPCTFHVVGESARFVAITSGDGAGRFFADVAGSVPVGQLLVPYLVVRIWMLVVCVLLIRRGGQRAGSLALGRTRLDSSRMAWSSLGSNILILRSRKESLWRPTNRP